jgi:hypothetical protein
VTFEELLGVIGAMLVAALAWGVRSWRQQGDADAWERVIRLRAAGISETSISPGLQRRAQRHAERVRRATGKDVS